MSTANDTNDVLLQLMTGKETFEDSSATVRAFSIQRAGDKWRDNPLVAQVSHTRQQTGPESRITWVGHAAWSNASTGATPFDPELGKWVTFSVACRNGVLVKIFASRKSGWQSRVSNGCLLLRMRREAALRRVLIPLTGARKAAFQTAMIQGRFDVMTLEEAESQGEYEVRGALRSYYTPQMINGLFDSIEVVEGELAPPPVVRERSVVVDGVAQTVRRRVSSRALKL